jgi:hypothetical protein
MDRVRRIHFGHGLKLHGCRNQEWSSLRINLLYQRREWGTAMREDMNHWTHLSWLALSIPIPLG